MTQTSPFVKGLNNLTTNQQMSRKPSMPLPLYQEHPFVHLSSGPFGDCLGPAREFALCALAC